MEGLLRRCALLLFAAVILCPLTPARCQERTQRLILNDGSYQSVVKYEMQGDRVHYLSAERYDWEDIPAALINWEATQKYNQELGNGKLKTLVETPEEKEEREKEEANSPEVAPGLRLPGSGGVFLADTFAGHPEVAEILQNGSDVDKSASKKNVLRSAVNPLGGTRQAFEIKGEHAQVQSHTPRPAIYIEIDEQPGTPADFGERFRIARATVKNGKRNIGEVKVSMGGKISEETKTVPAKVERVGIGAWLRLTPVEDLSPGEYALVEMLGPNEMNLYVWDFGVNANAPANPNAVAEQGARD